ncbi:MAG TPA: c-type cytochrome [Burkholderiales bacterium]|nr:c-type cytochrome [Burkholderiales bacterium]
MAEEIRIEEHSSPIKTPKQLVIVVLLAFAVPITLIVMIAQLVTGGAEYGKDHPAMSEEAIARRLKPVGEVVVADASAPRAEKSGKEVVEAVCAACHATGALQAPRIGDKAAWAKLLKEGLDQLTRTAVKGIRQMPPRGGNPDLTDLEVARAVVYMANQSGANWKEPAPKPAAVAAAPAAAPAPAATVPQPAASPAAAAKAEPAKGKAVYDANCTACHATGVAGAPKAGDKAAWAPRLKGGMEALYASSIKGKNAMPPKGGNLALAEADVKAAVDYMVGLVK